MQARNIDVSERKLEQSRHENHPINKFIDDIAIRTMSKTRWVTMRSSVLCTLMLTWCLTSVIILMTMAFLIPGIDSRAVADGALLMSIHCSLVMVMIMSIIACGVLYDRAERKMAVMDGCSLILTISAGMISTMPLAIILRTSNTH